MIQQIDKISLNTFLISFIIGSTLFIMGISTHSLIIIYFSAFFIFSAIIINTTLVIYNVIYAVFSRQERTEKLLGVITLLLNIPIVFLYVNLIF